MELGHRLEERLRNEGLSQNQLALRVGVATQTIWKLVNGQSRSSAHLHRIARELGTSVEYLTGETDDPAPGAMLSPARTDDDTMELAEIDLAYGMGGTFIDGEPEILGKHYFSKTLVRYWTRAKADDLFFARGAGDSMMPTIHDSDLVLIDRSEHSLRLADQIWAFAFGGVGMIKRLRPRPDGTVAILSDNAVVPEDRASDGEIHLIGRVAAIIKKA
jgi:phage repressor protein C with HTH and peptisase S24 domain